MRHGACAAATKNVAALNPNATDEPAVASSTPPSTGPTKMLACSATPMSAFARGRSDRRTRDGTMLGAAGQKNASAIPNTTPITKNCQIRRPPVAAKPVRIVTATPRVRCDPSMTVRGEKRSVTAPPTSTSSPRGIVAATTTAASTAGDREIDSTSQTNTT